jgi:hypothetical protein
MTDETEHAVRVQRFGGVGLVSGDREGSAMIASERAMVAAPDRPAGRTRPKRS